MAEEIIVKYKVDLSDFKKVETAVEDVTEKQKELRNEIKATYSGKEMDDAVRKLHEQGDTMEALILRYGDAGKALKAMQKELQTMAALGMQGTKDFKELTKATAELTDTIGDTRGEIKKLASDTRVFDLMVQGARGITAAFSVATGMTAAFGKESEDLQKAILKVQGAMAALQGVQELANLATEKGGIATKAYGVALTVVEKISKVTGASIAASWAMATAGIGLVIAGVVSLISYLNDADEASNKFEENRAKSQEAQRKQELEAKQQQLSALSDADQQFFKQQEIDRRARLAEGQKERDVEFQLLTDQIDRFQNKILAYKNGTYDYLQLTDDEEKQRIALMTDYINTALIARNKLLAETTKKGVKERTEIKKYEKMEVIPDIAFKLPEDESFSRDFVAQLQEQIDRTIDTTKAPEIPVTLKFKMPPDEAFQMFADNVASTLSEIQPIMQAGSSLINSIIGLETATLEQEKNKQLAIVCDNAKKREEIEKKFAIRKAQIEREQAIANKVFAIFDIAVNTAQSIAASAKQGFPQAIPFIVLAAATGALQAAAVAAQPLPQIPKFEKGGAVPLAGGRIDNGYLVGKSHREGGVLINAQGGEYIWDRETTARHGEIIKAAHEKRLDDLILHKYVAPALKAEAQRKQNETYDDYMLRHTIKQGHLKEKRNAEYIVSGVTKGVSEAITNSNRYR